MAAGTMARPLSAHFAPDAPQLPMKLMVQIPCLNEEESLPLTLAEMPRRVPGFDEVEWLVIDDARPTAPSRWRARPASTMWSG